MPASTPTLNALLDAVRQRCSAHLSWDQSAALNTHIQGITEDSRRVQKDWIFIARPLRAGADRPDSDLSPHDGRRYIASAVAQGACAVVVENAYDLLLDLPNHVAFITTDNVPVVSAHLSERFSQCPSDALSLVGITGTNGKTTVAWLIRCIMQHAGITTGTLGTTGVYIGDTHTAAKLTTPFAEDLSCSLAGMVGAKCRTATVEVSSHALDQHRADGLSFDIGVFTNLTGDHLDYHRTMASYASAKARLFAMLPDDGVAVLNADDPSHEIMLKRCNSSLKVVLCHMESVPKNSVSVPLVTHQVSTSAGLENENSSRAGSEPHISVAAQPQSATRATVAIIIADRAGMQLRLTGPFGNITQTVPLVGAHNAMNTLQATVIAHTLGVSNDSITAALSHLTAPAGRLEPVTSSADPFAIFVDFAHTDDALEKALTAARSIVATNARLICVFGCGGDRDRTKRPRMGYIAHTLADVVVVTSDNPRTENPLRVIDDIVAGFPSGDSQKTPKIQVHIDHIRENAIDWAVTQAQRGDVIVIAGKGHEDYQILPDGNGGTVLRDFDDRRVARAAIQAHTQHTTNPTA